MEESPIQVGDIVNVASTKERVQVLKVDPVPGGWNYTFAIDGRGEGTVDIVETYRKDSAPFVEMDLEPLPDQDQNE